MILSRASRTLKEVLKAKVGYVPPTFCLSSKGKMHSTALRRQKDQHVIVKAPALWNDTTIGIPLE
jgi:hypothetical protein